MNKRGQSAIIAMIFLVVGLVLYIGLMPVIIGFVNSALGTPGIDSLTGAILRLFVPVVALVILVHFLMQVLRPQPIQVG